MPQPSRITSTTGIAIAPTLTTPLRRHKRVLSLTSPSGRFYIAEVKRRNQLLALFCLLAFAGFGVLYFRYWVVQKPFGIILFIGEGLTPDRLAALRLYAGGAETPLTIDTLSYAALLKNYSNDSAIPDTAAAATAIATGVKVNNGSIGVDAEGNALENLIELARASGRTTGLLTDSRLTNPTAASFYAHTTSADDRQELAGTLVEGANIDIVLGGGSIEFLPETAEGTRSDERDLLNEASEAGYDVVRTRAELEAVAWWRWPRVFGVFGPAELTHGDEVGPETMQPTLSDMVRRGIELLQIHRGGYLLVVDAALMRTAAKRNDLEATLAAMLELDRAIAVALRFAGAKATVFVCGDVGVGGFKVSGSPSRTAGRTELLNHSLGETRITWATGPDQGAAGAEATAAPKSAAPPVVAAAPVVSQDIGGEQNSSHVIAPGRPQGSITSTASTTPQPSNESANAEPKAAVPASTGPALRPAPAALNTAEDVIAFGNGRGAEALHGVLDNTALFEIIRDNL